MRRYTCRHSWGVWYQRHHFADVTRGVSYEFCRRCGVANPRPAPAAAVRVQLSVPLVKPPSSSVQAWRERVRRLALRPASR